MAFSPNTVLVPTKDGSNNNVTVTNASILALGPSRWAVNWAEIPCVDGVGGDHILISAGMFGRHFVPEPFASAAGIQNPIVWGTFTMGPGYVAHSYSMQWFLENITQPIYFTLDQGQLPPGLILSTIGNTARGQIAGTPTQAGTFNFTLLATGPDLTAPKNFSILITQDPPPRRRGSAYVGGN